MVIKYLYNINTTRYFFAPPPRTYNAQTDIFMYLFLLIINFLTMEIFMFSEVFTFNFVNYFMVGTLFLYLQPRVKLPYQH